MRHTRAEVIKRARSEFARLDRLVGGLTPAQWKKLVPRPETKDPWTVKDVLAHITHWKADAARSATRERKSPEAKLGETEGNRVVYLRWHRRPAREVLAWHRQVQKDLLSALQEAPEDWYSGRERAQRWPYDLDGHSADHRLKDIERALETRAPRVAKPRRAG